MNVQIVEGNIEPGDLVIYRANHEAGLFTVTYNCTGFWGRPNGKVHISGFISTFDDGSRFYAADVYPAELVKVEPAEGG